MYLALYRKYRPLVFSDVVGQEHITTTLKNAVQSDRVAHAYLFTGTRGTGKTTCARILARAVNCLSPDGGNPCGQCQICEASAAGDFLDIVEIDAASNTGVDSIRTIRDETAYTPAMARRKVYIIDEVHMLSAGAFNALLKTLEDTPLHVMFILATTESHKVVPTILSRCQRFDFRRIPAHTMARRLQQIAGMEGIEAEEGAFLFIARLCDGSMRDALSLLDRCAAGGVKITADYVACIVGAASRHELWELASHASRGNTKEAMLSLNALYEGGKSAALICSEMALLFRNLMVVKAMPEPDELLFDSGDDKEALGDAASRMTVERIVYCLNTLQAAQNSLARATDPKTELEICLIKLCDPRLCDDGSAVLARVAEMEKKLSSGAFVFPSSEGKKAAAETPKPPRPTISDVMDKMAKTILPNEKKSKKEIAPFDQWPEVSDTVAGTLDKSYTSLLNLCSAYLSGDTLYIVTDNPVGVWRLNEHVAKSSIEKAAGALLLKKIQAKILSSKDFSKQSPAPVQGQKAGAEDGADGLEELLRDNPGRIKITDHEGTR